MAESKRTSDEAVKAATGKNWAEWFTILDDAGSVHREHKEIARWLADVEKVPPWWSQMVTVEYERARGLRKIHETATGFEVSVHRTLDVPLHDVYTAWADEKKRQRWLNLDLQLKSTRLDKILHFKLADGTKLNVAIDPSPSGKTRLGIAHTKLMKASDVEQRRSFWKAAVKRLERLLS